MDKWLTTEQAIAYLGISKTNLYLLSQEGKIPASKIGKKWVYEKESLDLWIRGNKPFELFFIETDYNIEENLMLRDPQREAYLSAYEFFLQGGQRAIIQLPVGCGKSGVAAILPFGIAKGKVLIIAPSLTIKDELYQNLDITNRQKCFWRKAQVLEDKDMIAGPYTCTLDSGNISICEKSHIIITNIHQLATNADKWLSKFKEDFFDLIVVDEGHHSAANSWTTVFDKFPKAKVVNLTATPFRSDRQEIDGELIYRYPFKSASIKGFIKKLKASYVVPEELTFTAEGETRVYTLEEVLSMKTELWFSKGIALSEACNISIADNSLEKLEQLRQTGTRHQIIAAACSVRHAKQIRSLYSERGYKAEVIYSELKSEEKDTIIRDLKNGVLDCIIQVQMLGEGFDHPKLSVAAIFNPYRTLAPYIQFIGRILRVIVQNDPTHPDNYGHIVTHIGMNLDELLNKFREFENDDQTFWESVVGGEEPTPSRSVIEGHARKNIEEKMIVHHEIIEALFEEDFVSLDNEDIKKELEEKLSNLGLDPSLASHILENSYKNRVPTLKKGKAAEPFQVQPQRQWEEARKRLDEEVKRTAKLLLNNCSLNMAGLEIPYKYKIMPANNNYMAAIQLVNSKVNKTIGHKKSRADWTIEEFKNAQNSLQNTLSELVKTIKKAQVNEA